MRRDGNRALGLAASTAWASTALAATAAAQEDPFMGRSTSFQAVEGPTREDIAGGPLLVAAYGVILVLLLAYVAWIARLEDGASRELSRLRAAVERAGKKPEAS